MMNKIIVLIIALFVFSCKDRELKKAEDAQTAGTEFIRASLDGDWKAARFFMLKSDDNDLILDKLETSFNRLSVEAKRLRRESNIRPISITAENDSLTKYKYFHTSNSKDTITLTILKQNGEWLVDAKSYLEK